MEATRQRILEAAGEIFAEKGFREATIREICQAADVNLASVNYHFRDKENLYIETVRAAHKRNVEARPLPPGFEDEGAERRLHLFILNLLERMLGSPDTRWENRLLLAEIIQPTRACEALVESAFRPQFEILLGILSELMRTAPKAPETLQVAFSVLGQCLFYRVAGRTADMIVGGIPCDQRRVRTAQELQTLARHITQVSLAGAKSYLQSLPPDESVSFAALSSAGASLGGGI